MTISASYRSEWQARFRRDADSYSTVLATDPFRNWEGKVNPEGSAEDSFVEALRVLYSHESPSIANALLDRSLAIVNRTVREGRLESEICRGSFPINRGILLRTFTYARACRGEQVELDPLRQASADFETWAVERLAGHWDSQTQAYYLAAARLSLIAGNSETAKRLLATRKSLKWHSREAGILKALAAWVPLDVRQDDLRLLGELETYLDEVRRPGYQPRVFIEGFILPFELAALREKYFQNTDGAVDWARVIDAVSE